MQSKVWNNTTAEPDRLERRMAEFIVHRYLPWSAIVGIAAIDEIGHPRPQRCWLR